MQSLHKRIDSWLRILSQVLGLCQSTYISLQMDQGVGETLQERKLLSTAMLTKWQGFKIVACSGIPFPLSQYSLLQDNVLSLPLLVSENSVRCHPHTQNGWSGWYWIKHGCSKSLYLQDAEDELRSPGGLWRWNAYSIESLTENFLQLTEMHNPERQPGSTGKVTKSIFKRTWEMFK